MPDGVSTAGGQAAGRRRPGPSWEQRLAAYAAAEPELAAELRAGLAGELPDGWDAELDAFAEPKKLATRAASEAVLNAIARRLPA